MPPLHPLLCIHAPSQRGSCRHYRYLADSGLGPRRLQTRCIAASSHGPYAARSASHPSDLEPLALVTQAERSASPLGSPQPLVLSPLAAPTATNTAATQPSPPTARSEIVRSEKHQHAQPPTKTRSHLRLSKLRHHHPVLPCYKDINTLARRVYTSFPPFRMGNYFLREAYNLPIGDQRLPRDDLA